MKPHFSLPKHDVHLWQIYLPDLAVQVDQLATLLSPDELQRAERYRFPQHKHQFIITRGLLRQILGQYLQQAPQAILFAYGAQGKPYVEQANLNVQFNVSHSGDMAVYALTRDAAIGVDIEQIKASFKDSVAKRFFSGEEYAQLCAMPDLHRTAAFYDIWSRKEALIKALGAGLSMPLSAFSVTLDQSSETIRLPYQGHDYDFYLECFFVHPDYQAAFATNQSVNNITYWQWQNDTVLF